MAAERKRKKKKTRSVAYKIRHNQKRSLRRWAKKYPGATALLRQYPQAAVMLRFALKDKRQANLLFPFLQLPRVTQPVRRTKRACQLAQPHQHERLKAPTRIRHLLGDPPLLKMFPSLAIAPAREFNGALASYQSCPTCLQTTLRIFAPAASGEFYFRCHHCGSCRTTLELLREAGLGGLRLRDHRSLQQVQFQALHCGQLAEPLSPETIQHYERLERWRNAIEPGRQQYRQYIKERGSEYDRFGDWLALDRHHMGHLLWDEALLKRFSKQQALVLINRNLYGFASGFTLFSNRVEPRAEIKFTQDTFSFVMPAWCDFVEWGPDILVCPNEEMALALERAVAKWPERERMPIATIAETSHPLTGSVPFRTLWLPVGPSDTADYGLMLFGDGQHDIRVTRFAQADPELKNLEELTRGQLCPPQAPKCLDVVAKAVAHGPRDVHLALNERLAQHYVGEAAGRALVARVAELRTIPVEQLINGIELRSNPFCFRLNGSLYVVRDGRFWKKKKRDREFGSITNFSLRIESSKPHRVGNNRLDIVLTSDGQQVHFGMTELEFNNASRLWRAVRMAAASAGLPYPQMTTVPERKFLPELIRGSHAWFPVPPRRLGLRVKTVVA